MKGPHFTLVSYGKATSGELAAVTWPAKGAGLKRVAIDGGESEADLRLSDINGSFKVSYGLTQDTMMLIRPDGYIAEIAKTDRINVLQRCAARLAPAPGGQG